MTAPSPLLRRAARLALTLIMLLMLWVLLALLMACDPTGSPLCNDSDYDGDGRISVACDGGTDDRRAPHRPELCDGADNDCDPATVDDEDTAVNPGALDGKICLDDDALTSEQPHPQQ